MAPELELIYFNARGRAEAIRLLLAEVNVDFVDTRFRSGADAMADFEKLKKEGLLPFEQVPILKFDGMVLAQSQAILRHLARTHDLAGKNMKETANADMIACGVDDLCQRFASALAADNIARDVKGSSYQPSVPEEFQKNILPKWNGFFEKFLKDSKSGFLTESFTYADLCVFDAMDLFQISCPDCLESFPLLKEHYARIKSRPKISEWLKKRPETAV
eukprot:Gregarina_sp_Pseudo_9__5272@NODE_604_length_2506_cov_130_481557_g570_i0_p2_GENE_NODE_604_length_2506_cov_130_481557_g570_i0NODE_604_length_2506_cov_130_481557_g570_i0_p2_ORF_typecomplete_len218_score33_01GST_C_3/PF14497_6/1_3e04GST_C_3/PF14497_6/1_6e20GST_N/PF02798_20/7_8e14GST_N/PF02798_20/1_1e04GST_C/PF00043_25/3_2e07GST_N_3/PF13417_6/7_2e07Tom37/PF10568_9/0_087Tom37/PF10568_9/4_8e02_NODE_604_length_2506_cov_130_481557_g570_i07211374